VETTAKSQAATEFLSNWNLRLEDLVGYIRSPQPTETVLLVGSIVEDLANPLSDIDLLLIGDGDLGEGFIQWEIESEEMVIRLPSGHEMNLEYWHTSALAQLRERLNNNLDLIGSSLPRRGLSRLSEAELRLLHRLRCGVGLVNQEVTDYWRAQLRVEELPLYLILSALALHFAIREDAIAQVRYGGDTLTSLTMLRLAADYMAAAMIASTGETNHSRKWRPRLLMRHRDVLGEERVAELQRYLFPNPQEDAAVALGEALKLFDTSILEIIGRYPSALPVMLELDDQVSFVKDLDAFPR
jgi:hypothetical protein